MKYNVTIGKTLYEVEVEDLNQRPIRARIGDEVFEVTPVAAEMLPPPQPLAAPRSGAPLTAGNAPAAHGKLLTAPLPGLLTEINVCAGDSVKPGQQICVIEAMKMKNAIRATGSGKVAKVNVAAGQSVTHRQALVEFE